MEVGELARATVGLLWEEPVTALCVLEQVMAKACNLEEVLEKKIVTREQVVQLMEGQKSKDVSVVAARVLSSIVGSDEVSQACLSLKQVDDHTASSCELLSNLLLADSDIDVDHLLADLLAILHNHTQVSQRHDGVLILKSVLGAITRVIDLKGVAIRGTLTLLASGLPGPVGRHRLPAARGHSPAARHPREPQEAAH